MASFAYDPRVIQTIGSLDQACNDLERLGTLDGILAAFRDVVVSAGQSNTYGLGLLHRHTDVAGGKRLMDLGYTLQPWAVPDDATSLYGASLRPKSLAVRDGKWLPYEFEFGNSDEVDVGFFDSVMRLLQARGASHCLGLRRYSSSAPEEVEITEHDGVSLKIPSELVPQLDSGFVDTFWAFPENGVRRYQCRCWRPGPGRPFHCHWK